MQSNPENNPLVVGVQHRADLVPLTEDEVRFEIDMCIGCDRCMRACPVPLSSMVNLADLNLATVSDEIAPHVARFTNECVMCGSCVPVCPVNNHRDLLMLSLKQRLGISWDGNVDMSHILDYLPQGWDVPLLLSRLREQPMLRDRNWCQITTCCTWLPLLKSSWYSLEKRFCTRENMVATCT